jgi:hypothetical protein
METAQNQGLAPLTYITRPLRDQFELTQAEEMVYRAVVVARLAIRPL